TLVDEIISFVEELAPERYAEEWSDASGQFSPTRYLQAVADMDDIRTRAWLLAVELSELARIQDEVLTFQWFLWN
ncbi:MAG: Nif3-like dinuclear metal center hexameric protein, partial [Duncaniella sp.]|nr:Nif3-like dinuclear metal center hexameric protein [Duncaniella sp.]